MNRIAQDVARRIQTEEFEPGDKLPSAVQLLEEYNATVTEAQDAIADLIYEGRAERNPAQPSEIRVRTPYAWDLIGGNHSVTKAAKVRGQSPGVQIIRFEQLSSWPIVQERLSLEPDDEVIIMERLRLADDRPVSLEFSYYPAKLFPGMTMDMFTGKGTKQSSFKVIQEKFGLIPEKAVDELDVAAIEPREAGLLNIDPGTPVLIRFRLTISDQGVPIKGSRAIYLFRAGYELPI
ncbi:MAG: GntR family transcriptional regulator [Anaerolineales bacterium]|jgi:GntR family transcriptional regulator